MKRWITLLAAGALALCVTAPTLAAPAAEKPAAPKAAKGKRAGGMKRFEAALAKLNLTAEQKPKVDAAVKTAQAESKKIREGAGAPQEKRPKMREVQKGLQTKLRAILTPEQQKQLKEALAASRPKRGAKGQKPATS
ncbi:MAG: hypothetical protein ACO1SX_06280 [Actinomycetota bacterium]